MKKHTIRLVPLNREVQVNDATPLIDVLHEFGIEFPCGGRGTCGKCKVRLLEGDVAMTEDHSWKLERLQLTNNWRLACMSSCTGDLTLEIGQLDHLILADESDFEFTPAEGCGVAVDVGTSTLVAQLVDLSDGKVLAVETRFNPQGKFGADLISRIQSCLEGKQQEMRNMIRRSIGEMILSMIGKSGCKLQNVVLVGNTVMHHIFSDYDVTLLSVYPFQTDHLGVKSFTARKLGWKFRIKESVRFFPSIGSFVGSDILAGIAATKMYLNEGYTALIDLGTNGEIAVGNRERIVCASTAAGPAFEGANISMGMRAVTGAVSSFSMDEGTIRAKVIGNTSPSGICGSALIDAVAILRKAELIGMFGGICSGAEEIRLTDHIKLTQKDINEFLLAKAAIATGLEILTGKLAIRLKDLDAVYLAGGFGNYINLQHVRETGMIDFPVDNIHKMGNTALIGAKMFLFRQGDEMTGLILSRTTHINLESDPGFQEIFVGNLQL
jgi:uncharacterized 2Fe-2S/4Fe-4S cluster protein (DUF4445 family)